MINLKVKERKRVKLVRVGFGIAEQCNCLAAKLVSKSSVKIVVREPHGERRVMLLCRRGQPDALRGMRPSCFSVRQPG